MDMDLLHTVIVHMIVLPHSASVTILLCVIIHHCFWLILYLSLLCLIAIFVCSVTLTVEYD